MGTVRNARVNQGGPKCAGIVGLGLIGGSFARGYAPVSYTHLDVYKRQPVQLVVCVEV